jgi:protein involved in polysaccharide export with SLBB domain
MSGLRVSVLIGVALAALWQAAPAQQAVEREAWRLAATRAELSELLARLASDSTSAAAGIVRRRLAEGDFRVGDGVALSVDGETQLSDTFAVGAAREITLPLVGAVTLAGVLYTEIEDHLTRQLGRYLREPVVHARALVRVLVSGAVPRPGVYLISPDAPLSATLTAAGGVTSDAKLRELRAERAGTPLLTGADMQRALAEGRTLDQASLRSGDEVVVPGQARGATPYERARLVGVILGIPLTIYSLTRIF